MSNMDFFFDTDQAQFFFYVKGSKEGFQVISHRSRRIKKTWFCPDCTVLRWPKKFRIKFQLIELRKGSQVNNPNKQRGDS